MDDNKALPKPEQEISSQQRIESNQLKLPDEKKTEEDDRDKPDKEDGKTCCNKCPTCRKKVIE
jgi:hypothetical protein